MWMLVPVAFAGKLLSAFRKPLRSLWSSLVPWVLWLRATLWLPGGQSARPPQPGRGEPQESRGDGGQGPDQPTTPTSVNYHFTRQCNYKCGFCFHTAKTSFVLPLDEAKRGLRLLQEAGEYLDILAISCDSFDEQVNVLIGRGQGKKNHVENLQKLRTWCRDYRVAFKINSVINRFNVDEDMREQIKALNPVRWKVFQCLLIEGENSGEDALREAQQFIISDEEFEGFLDRHKEVSCLVPESNQKMKDSYLILDEYMRFLNCRNGRKDPSKSILDVGVEEAIKFSGFDEKMFLKRGGKYVWSKADLKLDW
ncbi:radical S-adenosyl methionine domain-containing protein 2 isoform X2 [Prionailurus viverrinus]|uniref:radical S-adenosyl methionine domain-containing protein 2 isoform X2 n=1 Tax=Felis catus TaxID=9685 RepID=UPI001D1A2DA3|nr:radical S-adenosyl methionine domain-containing protein 2 isoform X2 [Felis catus]XP_047701111.1 radical S-adenosyl methionine domain-containing protein 2 isoform X2 [Prionailurus viverrinus]